MVIYTKKGDKGLTGLLKGKRVSKSSSVIDAIGAVDEANSYLGICLNSLSNQPASPPGGSKSKKELINKLQKIQKDLLAIGAILAGADRRNSQSLKTKGLEREIDKLEEKLPKQKNFILAGGTLVATHLMYARALVRRAEREVAGLGYVQILPYLNRLSDYLFILVRWENFINKYKEIVWKPKN